MSSTFDSIMQQLCSFITLVRTTVGSFCYMILAAVTFKLLEIEEKIYSLKQNMKVKTADDSAMDDLASNRGLTRKPATVGVARGRFNIEIPEGSRFQLGEVVWVSSELISQDTSYYYKMISEQTGSSVNKAIGVLTPITFIEGLVDAYIEDILIPAEDIETTESLRERYQASFKSKSFGGNKAAYKEYIENIDGVGGCKVYPIKYGNGTVGITIIDSMYSEPSTELVENIQEIIDPDKNSDGEGQAPIGAIVTVSGVTKENIKIGIKCIFESGTFDDWKTEIENVIKSYFLSKNKNWADSTEIVIRKAEVIAEVLKCEKVVDVIELLINDLDENLILSTDSIANLSELEEIE